VDARAGPIAGGIITSTIHVLILMPVFFVMMKEHAQFTLAEFTGGPLMIAIMVLLFKAFLTPRIVEAARQQADKGIQGRMEGHAATSRVRRTVSMPCPLGSAAASRHV
jgi:hypothetical protein